MRDFRVNIMYLHLQDQISYVKFPILYKLHALCNRNFIHLLEKELRYFLGPELVREVFLLFREPSCQVVEARSDLKD